MPESQEATSPADMLQVKPPEGVVMTEDRVDEANMAISTFGLKTMMLGKIRTFAEEPVTPSEYVDGTFLVFQPGGIYAHVIRRDISANDINKIGLLSAEIDDLYRKLGFIPKVLPLIKELTNGLRTIAERDKKVEIDNKSTDSQTEQEVDSLGTIRKRLEASQLEIESELGNNMREIYGLGVTLIQTKTRSTLDGSFPVKKYLENISSPSADSVNETLAH